MNYTGKLRDVATLSHELGHALHGEISQIQSSSVYHPSLSLAETASVFCEMLLSEHLDATLSDEEKKSILDERLSDMFATIHRQIQYVSFEREVHEHIRGGEELTYKEFGAIWRKHQRMLYPSELMFDVEDQEETGWAMIPHIFGTPFYCYAYSFAQLVVLALYEQYRSEGKPFIQKYKAFLASGGSGSPEELLSVMNIDIHNPEFYRGGLRTLERFVESYESLT